MLPFLGILKGEFSGNGELSEADLKRLCEVTVELVDHIQQEVRLVGFWKNPVAQSVLRSWIVQFLDDEDIIDFDRLAELADRIVELAKVNHPRLAR